MGKIYTKTGDKGQTALIGGTRIAKSDLRIECYGTVDELNAHLGLLNDQLQAAAIPSILKTIQNRLFDMGALLACAPEKEEKFALPKIKESDISLLEKEIDLMNETLPKMTHFILPGGHVIVSQAHIARCVCRRAERLCVALFDASADKNRASILIYINRLSDYIFVLGRYIGHQLNVEEVKWQP